MTELEKLQSEGRTRLRQSISLGVALPPHIDDTINALIALSYQAGRDAAVDAIDKGWYETPLSLDLEQMGREWKRVLDQARLSD